jgi:acyl-CoA thioester hydrolase/thioesterase-3
MSTEKGFSRFESELVVRPDDIDMNNHVHNSRYLDYVLAARYDQMKRCYKMSMDEFAEMGLTWVVKSCFIEFKRALVLGDTIIVRTGIEEVGGMQAKVRFEIIKKKTGKLASDGYFEYAMINIATGRAEKIPPKVVEKYSI